MNDRHGNGRHGNGISIDCRHAIDRHMRTVDISMVDMGTVDISMVDTGTIDISVVDMGPVDKYERM